MYITNDPVSDAMRYEHEQEAQLEQLPLCDMCGEHIQDGYYYDVGGDIVCQSCLDFNYKKLA